MTRYLSALGLAAVTLGCGVAHAPEEAVSSDPARLESSASCPALATTCPAGCFTAGAHPVDRANLCLRTRQMFGCSSFEVGPPALACSVGPDETIWISFENRQHPRGRACDTAESKALGYAPCP